MDRFTRNDLRTFCVAFALLFLMFGAGRLAVVFFVDPLERFISDPHHFTANRERWAKPMLVKKYPHNALLVGTSKLAHVNPDDINVPGFKFFNASVAGGTPEEMFTFIDLFGRDAKLVVISYDIMTMNDSIWGLQPHQWEQPKWFTMSNLEYVTGFDHFTTSVNFAFNGRPPSTVIRINGSRDAWHDVARSNAMQAFDFKGALAQINGAAYAKFTYSNARIEYIERTKKLLDDRHTPYIVLISPEDKQVLALIQTSGNQANLDRFRADIHRIFPDAIDYSDSWVSADENFLKFDPMHYLPSVGAEMIRDAIAKSRGSMAIKSH